MLSRNRIETLHSSLYSATVHTRIQPPLPSPKTRLFGRVGSMPDATIHSSPLATPPFLPCTRTTTHTVTRAHALAMQLSSLLSSSLSAQIDEARVYKEVDIPLILSVLHHVSGADSADKRIVKPLPIISRRRSSRTTTATALAAARSCL